MVKKILIQYVINFIDENWDINKKLNCKFSEILVSENYYTKMEIIKILYSQFSSLIKLWSEFNDD